MGDRTRAVIGDRARQVTITGEVHFGSLFGATAVLVDEATARRAFAPDGTVTVPVGHRGPRRQPGDAARRRRTGRCPPTSRRSPARPCRARRRPRCRSGLAFFTTFLLVFAGVALFVGSFIIVNTFSMLVGQRARELALLRAIGATRAQVIRTVLGEAVVIGLVGSVLGIALGLLIAAGAGAAIRTFLSTDIGSDLPLSATTVVLSVLVGVVVTVVSAVLPARRASRVAPVAAMRGDVGSVAGGLRQARPGRPRPCWSPARWSSAWPSPARRSPGRWRRSAPSRRCSGLLVGRAAGDPARRTASSPGRSSRSSERSGGSPARTRCAFPVVRRPRRAP